MGRAPGRMLGVRAPSRGCVGSDDMGLGSDSMGLIDSDLKIGSLSSQGANSWANNFNDDHPMKINRGTGGSSDLGLGGIQPKDAKVTHENRAKVHLSKSG
eukprot:Hpha_TRINITY_DN27261_c0_g1::TRINITY_DN27261_c0_g1_i1::g.140706::m.140706